MGENIGNNDWELERLGRERFLAIARSSRSARRELVELALCTHSHWVVGWMISACMESWRAGTEDDTARDAVSSWFDFLESLDLTYMTPQTMVQLLSCCMCATREMSLPRNRDHQRLADLLYLCLAVLPCAFEPISDANPSAFPNDAVIAVIEASSALVVDSSLELVLCSRTGMQQRFKSDFLRIVGAFAKNQPDLFEPYLDASKQVMSHFGEA